MTDQELAEILDARQGNKKIQEELEAEIEVYNKRIKEALGERGVRKAIIGPWVPQLVLQERKTLDPKKLLSAGVSIAQIEAATTVNQIESLRVGPRGKEDV